MWSPEQHLQRFAEAGLLSGTRLLAPDELKRYRDREVVAALEGQVAVAGRAVTLCIAVDRRFPLSLPLVFLNPWDALGFLPHVNDDGYVCYEETEGLLLNTENPLGILVAATQSAVRVLEDGVAGRNQQDFLDEFGAYWRRAVPTRFRPICSLIDVSGVVARTVTAYCEKKDYRWVADNDSQMLAYCNQKREALASLTQRNALYIPLTQVSAVRPPLPGRLWTIEEVRSLIMQGLAPRDARLLRALLYGWKWKHEELVVLGLPRPSGGVILVGLVFRNVRGGHPLLDGSADDPPEPIEVQRKDARYLLPRGGTRTDLSRKRVLLAGCGSVGGYIAALLPQAGLLDLTLVDPDYLAPENVFRHVLGRLDLGRPKVEALKRHVESRYPYVSVTPHKARIEDAVSDGTVRFSDFDLLIFAVGNPTIELHMNRLVHQQQTGPIAVFTWLEPYGIGGHALVTRPGVPGCLQCLYNPATDQEAPLANRAAFAGYGQRFAKDDLGCGSLYTPYGGLDAQQTAHLAVRASVDALTGNETGNPILSWKGPDQAFTAAGFQVSRRYLFTADQLYESRYAYVEPGCPVCGESRR